MPAVALPSRRLPMLQLAMRRELLTVRVHCSHPGCGWSCPARDEEDACEVLSDHLSQVHLPNQEKTYELDWQF